ncbi:hypothetical protein VTJ04DRAFT_9648 [Mycothermus thermophilus]|uniref:uncharacterized protein n=1 Tax=Humicola insolens TaxID=85995 RepID=UPI0037445BA2
MQSAEDLILAIMADEDVVLSVLTRRMESSAFLRPVQAARCVFSIHHCMYVTIPGGMTKLCTTNTVIGSVISLRHQ